MKKWQSRKLILIISMLVLIMPAIAQTTVGKDFWVTFLPNGENNPDSDDDNYEQPLSLVVTSQRACLGRVTNPNTNWSTTFEVQPRIATIVSIPTEGNYQDHCINLEEDSDCVLNHGLHVVTNAPVSLYANNGGDGLADATCVLPTESLGNEYIIQTCPSAQGAMWPEPEFSIIAVENNTIVDINLTDKSAYGHDANTPFTVTLQAGQCYQIMCSTSYLTSRDLSGTHIKSRNGKPIAVFAGSNVGGHILPGEERIWNHLYEQMMPVSSWGRQFVVTGAFGNNQKDVVRITSLNNFCEIKRNGVPVDTIHARQSYEYVITSSTPHQLVETSEPAQVYIYHAYMRLAEGGATMAVVNPLEQWMRNDVTFCTFTTSGKRNHYVNIVTETAFVFSMKLDGVSISSQFRPVAYNRDYSYAKVRIQPGSHTLSNDTGGFVAQVYGLAYDGIGYSRHSSYAYSIGSIVNSLTSEIMVDEQYTTSFTNDFWHCEDDTVNFSLFSNFEVSRADWRFGDNTMGSGTEIAHHYPEPGNYDVSCDVYKLSSSGQDTLINTLTAQIHILQPTEQDLYASDCDVFHWHNETYTESGVFTYHGYSIGGCDSIVNLHLDLYPSLTIPYETTACSQYEWHDSIYTQTGIYTHYEGQTNHGCDSIAELYLTVEHVPQLTILGLKQVYSATALPSGVYIYRVSDTLNIEPNTLEWVCSNPEWIVVPLGNGYSCKLIVTVAGQGTLKAITHNSVGCDTWGSIEINATVFDVEGNESMQVKLFPNPARTEVSLVAPQLLRVRIYNSMGQSVKEIAVKHSDPLSIDIEDLKPGIYIVEMTTSLGKTARRLSVIR